MRNKISCFNIITNVVLGGFLLLSFVLTLLFWTEEQLNLNTHVTNIIWSVYWDIYPAWIGIAVSLANILFGISMIQRTVGAGESKRKLLFYICYAVTSLIIFILSFITADYIFGSVVASV